MKIKLPTDVRMIIDRFEKNGFSAYAVGGCVRDSLLQKEPNDWDICTDALPQDILPFAQPSQAQRTSSFALFPAL